MQEIQIQPRDVYEHYVYVKHPGTTLHWTFSTKKKNIHFGLFYRTGSPIAFVDHATNTLEKNNTTTPNGSGIKSTSISNSLNTFTSDNNGNRKLSLGNGNSINHLRRKSLASLHLIEHDFQEIIPIGYVCSSEEQVNGSYTVTEPGNCILIFDNTMSINTSKILRFQVTSDEPIQEGGVKEGDYDISGYLLKKRRKRMQGWCRRWFELSSKGLLSYSVNPGGIKRGSIQILMTMISIYPKQRTIHLDTGTTVYHLKALTKENFDSWVDVFRRQRALGQRNKDAGILVDGAWLLPDNRYRLTPNPTLQTRQQQSSHNNTSNKNGTKDGNALNIFIEDEDEDEDDENEEEGCDYFIRGSINKDFKNLADELDILQSEINSFIKKKPSPSSNNNNNSSSNKYSLENATSHSSSRSSSFIASTTTTNSNNSSIKKKFPFRRGSSQPDQQSQHPLTTLQPPTNHQHQLNESPSQSATDTLIIQQSSLNQWMESIQRMIQLRDAIEKKYNQQEIDWMLRIKKPSYPYGSIYNQQGSEFGTPRTHSFYSYHSSNHSEMYYEAEEFELSHDEDDDADIVQEKNDDNDEDEDSSLEVPNNNETTTLSKPFNDVIQSPIPSLTKRRTILPHTVAGENVNILGVLRKNIGKDLSTITMPISLNEPLNLLQRLCEELEYSELLDQANHMDDPIDRLMYVTIFAITGYASSQYRIGRKFWNPLLFETYECIRPDKGFKFISEKVSHRPNVMACHAESDNFTFWQSTEGSTKFWGKSMEFISEGTIHVKLPKHKDHFVYTKPSSHMRNMILGQRYLEHVGQVKVMNKVTGDYAIVNFKEGRKIGGGGYFAGGQWERNEVEALFYSSSIHKDQPIKKVVGKWSQSLSQELGDQQFKILWQVKPPTVDHPMDYYGFTQFCMELNEITDIERDQLPPTDTRYRPDQHLFELGKVDEAEKEKDRVEVSQRERRSQNEAAGISPQPLWFQQSSNDPSEWEYKGGYFEARKTGEWPKEMLTLW
ncbi:unnamed protein product [Cunninghamella blakesleeana]